ncbi:MAG: hypothetical protein U0822_27345, partial [Anaerolineae bacterium]
SAEQMYWKHPSSAAVVDHDVFRIGSDQDFALSKNNFADYILQGDQNFTGIDFSAFTRIFEIIRTILLDVQNDSAAFPSGSTQGSMRPDIPD